MTISAHAISRQNGVTHPKRAKSVSKRILYTRYLIDLHIKEQKSYRRRHSQKKHVSIITCNNGNFHDYISHAQNIFREDTHISHVTQKLLFI